jgi:hypothetical protein
MHFNVPLDRGAEKGVFDWVLQGGRDITMLNALSEV